MIGRGKYRGCGDRRKNTTSRMLTYEVTSPARELRSSQCSSHQRRTTENIIQHQQEPPVTRLDLQQRRNVESPIPTTEPYLETQAQQSEHQSSAASNTQLEKHVRGKYKSIKVDMKTRTGKLEVLIPDDILRAVGNNARDIVNYCGYIVRSYAPIFVDKENADKEKIKVYADWSDVVKATGEIMWTRVKDKFKVPSGQENKFHGFILSTLQRLYRCWKSRLHMVYKKFNTDEERWANIPEDVKLEDWELLIHHFGSEVFQKVSKRNANNRLKLITKHTCGSKSFAEVEDQTRDLLTGEKAPPDEVWLCQHTKKDKEGNLQWSDSNSREVHEKLHDLVTQQAENPESQMTRDEMLLQVLGEKPGYFRGKGAGKKAPTKRGRYQDNVQEEVQKAVESFKEQITTDLAEKQLQREAAIAEKQLQREADLAEKQLHREEQLKLDIRAQMQGEFDKLFQERIATFFSSMTRLPHSQDSNRDTQ